MAFQIIKAAKIQSKARIGIVGLAGSGKTYSALAIGTALGGKVAVIDTENASAAKYAGVFDFDVLVLDTFAPRTYVEAIHAVEDAGYDVLIIDSLSHAWAGKGGALEMVDNAARRSSSGNSFSAWRDVTPEHNKLVDALVRCKCHLLVTMRSKMEYVLDKDDRGKTAPRKVGLAPIQREGLDYEMDIAGDMDLDHNWSITKTRCPALDGQTFNRPGTVVAQTIISWLSDGAAPPPERPVQNGKPGAREALETRLAQTIAEAQALGIDVTDADQIAGKDDAALIAAGKRLRVAIERAKLRQQKDDLFPEEVEQLL